MRKNDISAEKNMMGDQSVQPSYSAPAAKIITIHSTSALLATSLEEFEQEGGEWQ
ncbi:MAG: hypothetical protein MJZ04_03285 [Bacteroidales bacterium]|nr:hypothetical protein [Bacteroidales bacterium]